MLHVVQIQGEVMATERLPDEELLFVTLAEMKEVCLMTMADPGPEP